MSLRCSVCILIRMSVRSAQEKCGATESSTHIILLDHSIKPYDFTSMDQYLVPLTAYVEIRK